MDRTFNTNNFINILFSIVDLKNFSLKFNLSYLYTVLAFYIIFIEKKHLPEDGHNRWPKHVAGYAEYNKSIQQHAHLTAIFIRNHQCMFM